MQSKRNPNVTCEQCRYRFYVPAFRLPSARFCSNDCKNLANRKPPHITEADIDRFWSKVDRTDGLAACWIWTAARQRYGYGRFGVRYQLWETHRFVWTITNGPIPDGMCVCHDCPEGDNPSCVNPSHLFLGTNKDNVNDKVAKGRQSKAPKPKGEQSPRSKLTEQQARSIKSRYLAREASGAQLAREYVIHRSTVYAIASGRRWPHI